MIYCEAFNRPLRDPNFMSSAFLLTDDGISDRCQSRSFLRALTARTATPVDPDILAHIGHCPRCSQIHATFRGLQAHRALAPDFIVSIIAQAGASIDGVQLFGYLNLEHGRISWCIEEDWIRSPLHLRVTLVIDVLSDTFGLNISDVPTTIHGAELSTPAQSSVILESIEGLESLYLNCSLADFAAVEDSQSAADLVFEWLRNGNLYLHLRITSRSESISSFRALLETTAAIEREYDYELPSGLHTDTHINIGRLCRSERYLDCIARELDDLLAGSDFQVILTNGWAMGTVARRLSWIRSKNNCAPIDVVVREGYQQGFLSADILGDSAVLVLVDVNVTGGLVEQMCDAVLQANARIAAKVALVQAISPKARETDGLQALCTLVMEIIDPWDANSSCLALRESRVFNPVSHCMTERAQYARSPSEFLSTNPEALKFWTCVNLARAYEHHRREGETHYLAFIDTCRLLGHPEIGQALVEGLRDRIVACGIRPEVVLIPKRPRARLLAVMLAESFDPVYRPNIVVASRPRRTGKKCTPRQPWELKGEECKAIEGRVVLVLDTAAAQGATIDRLVYLATNCHAASISAAVLISRLPDGCEEAFSARLATKFHCMYRLPIRPIVVRGSDPRACPVCQRRAAIEQVGNASNIDDLQQWALQLRRRAKHGQPAWRMSDSSGTQLRLFSKDVDFLEKCGQSVASGVTLHALNAAMTNGMAALTLPELFDDRIPSRNRTAMLEHLPQGAVEWSGECLVRDLRGVLDKGTAPNVWRASAEALVRGGENQWLQEYTELLTRLRNTGAQTSKSFWNYLACTTYAAISQDDSLRPIVQQQLNRLASRVDEHSSTAKGVARILETIPE